MFDLLSVLHHAHTIYLAAAPTTMAGLQTDTTNLLNSGSNYLMGTGGVAGGTMLGYHSVMKVVNDDPQQVSHHTASQKKVMVGTVAVLMAGGLVHIVTSFF